MSPERTPNRILVFDSFPIGPSGKVERKKLTHAAASMIDAESAEGTDASVRDQVIETAATLFGTSSASLDERSSADDVEGWTSLTFLELIVALERRFAMTIAPRTVMTIRTLGDAVQAINAGPTE